MDEVQNFLLLSNKAETKLCSVLRSEITINPEVPYIVKTWFQPHICKFCQLIKHVLFSSNLGSNIFIFHFIKTHIRDVKVFELKRVLNYISHTPKHSSISYRCCCAQSKMVIQSVPGWFGFRYQNSRVTYSVYSI